MSFVELDTILLGLHPFLKRGVLPMLRLLHMPLVILGALVMLAGESNRVAAQKPGLRPMPGGGPAIAIPLAPEGILKVRLPEPADNGFDDKGNIKAPSAAERSKAKGDTPAERKLPGYKGSIDRLKPGDIVQVTLSNAKPDPKDKDKKVYTPSGKPPITGRIVHVDAGQITLMIGGGPGPLPPPPGRDGGPGKGPGGNATTLPDTTPGTMIVLVQANPNPPPGGKPPPRDK
jgi:hypothetical protein